MTKAVRGLIGRCVISQVLLDDVGYSKISVVIEIPEESVDDLEAKT